MLRALAVAACVAGASAFSASPMLLKSGSRTATTGLSGMKMQEDMSASVPFLPRPAALDGSMVGDVGFDPLGFTTKYDIKWLREAELKHGRVCMLASLGCIVQEIVHLPFEATSNPVASEAFFQVPAGGLWQIFAGIGIIEHFSNNFKMSGATMFSDGRAPGDLGFDPLGFGKNEGARARYELAELKNGRLAMLGFSGMIHGCFITGKGPLGTLAGLDWHQSF